MGKEQHMTQYRILQEEEIDRDLFREFIRRQNVTKCWRKEEGAWVIKDAPFVDDWTEEDYQILVSCLKNTAATGGFVYGAFCGGVLKGLSSIQISEDVRGQGIGKRLFLAAKDWAREKGAGKLYISAHSAVESQAFYRAMGCVEALEYQQAHVEKEPFDCQLECRL